MKAKLQSFIIEDKIQGILEKKFPNKECPECHKNGIYAGCIERQYNEMAEEYEILSFDVFCEACGAFLIKWG